MIVYMLFSRLRCEATPVHAVMMMIMEMYLAIRNIYNELYMNLPTL